jgi:hypothetical protein
MGRAEIVDVSWPDHSPSGNQKRSEYGEKHWQKDFHFRQ